MPSYIISLCEYREPAWVSINIIITASAFNVYISYASMNSFQRSFAIRSCWLWNFKCLQTLWRTHVYSCIHGLAELVIHFSTKNYLTRLLATADLFMHSFHWNFLKGILVAPNTFERCSLHFYQNQFFICRLSGAVLTPNTHIVQINHINSSAK